MKRIMVVGISAGVGKSTFARKLGEILGIEVTHLDSLFWKPGWVEASLEEFSAPQKEIVKKPDWIIEGNYSSTFELRFVHADTIVYLELPLYVCLYRVLKRWLTNLGKNRPDMGDGCTEKMEWAFLKFIITTYHSRKSKMEDRMERFQSLGPEKKVFKLKSKSEIADFLDELERKESKVNGTVS
ncbi:topology modulation protein [Bacillus salacetis]|uniref:Topology modulation protein n=1 Tax=Bacillus salacetis TaxID=2315464 RepID=A0A3A1QUR9_9BACI|nr:topology modulation protein [Bacillus salacetis]RIW30929.1 topology modulation protein [Bacillus salacetis]